MRCLPVAVPAVPLVPTATALASGTDTVIRRATNPANGARGEIAFAPAAGTRVTGLRLRRSVGRSERWSHPAFAAYPFSLGSSKAIQVGVR